MHITETGLTGKSILIVEDDVVFRSVITAYLHSMGAIVQQADNGFQALDFLTTQPVDLILCDLAMPEMGGIEFVERFFSQSIQIPVLVISATNKIADIAIVLRMGVKDVLLKPITDLSHFREAVLACLYPKLSLATEEIELLKNWEILRQHPHDAMQLLQRLQPPLQQIIACCRISYCELTDTDSLGFVIGISELSENDLAFYCLDIIKPGTNGILVALLLRILFSRVLKKDVMRHHSQFPEISLLMDQLNQLLHQTHLTGQYPLLAGYYNVPHRNLILVSAGLNANISINDNNIQLSGNVPLGVLDATYPAQVNQHCDAWQCQIFGDSHRLKLMLSVE